MDVSRNSRSMATTITGRIVALASPETERFMMLGQDHAWNFNVLGQAPMPTEPARIGDWLIVPAYLDSSPLPERTFERLQAIFTAGLRPKGFVVVHEAPLLLASPARGDTQKLRLPLLPSNLRSTLKVIGYGLGGWRLSSPWFQA